MWMWIEQLAYPAQNCERVRQRICNRVNFFLQRAAALQFRVGISKAAANCWRHCVNDKFEDGRCEAAFAPSDDKLQVLRVAGQRAAKWQQAQNTVQLDDLIHLVAGIHHALYLAGHDDDS